MPSVALPQDRVRFAISATACVGFAAAVAALWAERCRARGVVIRPLTFAGIGVVGVPLVLLGTWAVASG